MSIAKGPLMAKKLDPYYWGNPPQTQPEIPRMLNPNSQCSLHNPRTLRLRSRNLGSADKLTLTFRNHRMDSNPLNPILKLRNLHQRKLTILKLLPRSIVVVSLQQSLPLSSLFF